jgi:GNAT superfamily N-acetyltransferase
MNMNDSSSNTADAPDVLVEPAATSDIPVLIDLLSLLFSIERDFLPDPEKQRRGLELLLARPENGVVMVARKDGKVAGMASAQLVMSTAAGAPSAWVEDVILFPDHRGRGLGRRLLEALQHWAEGKGARRLQLLADADNLPAIAFYRHLGWRSTRLFALHRMHMSGDTMDGK